MSIRQHAVPAPAAGGDGMPGAAAPPMGQHPAPSTHLTQSPAQFPVPVAVTDPQWPQAVAERVRWTIEQRHGVAELSLDPPELGRIAVRVVLVDDQGRVAFSAQHAVARDHLQAALPRLHQMFEGSGIALADASVSGGGAGGTGTSEASHSGDPDPGEGSHDAEVSHAAEGWVRIGLIDDFV